jgi:hypothetical protein
MVTRNNQIKETKHLKNVIILFIGIIFIAILWAFINHANSNKVASPISKTHIASQPTISLPTGRITNISNEKTYNYPGNYFSFSYPSNWSLKIQPLYSQAPFTTQLNISPPNAPKSYASGNNAITIRAYRSSSLINAADQFETTLTPALSQYLKINGNQAIFQQYSQAPSLNKETYTDDVYAINKGNTTVVLYFRVNESAMSAGNGFSTTPSFNESSMLPILNSIVMSIKFD